jgi:hypothetical protein
MLSPQGFPFKNFSSLAAPDFFVFFGAGTHVNLTVAPRQSCYYCCEQCRKKRQDAGLVDPAHAARIARKYAGCTP